MVTTDYADRRKKLLAALDSDSIAILVAAPELIRNGDSTYLYRQNSDFYYFTEFDEPEAVAIFAPNSEYGNFILFNRPRNKTKELWGGPIVGQENACKIYGADSSFPISEIDNYLPKILQGRSKIYFEFAKTNFNTNILTAVSNLRQQVRSGVKAPSNFLSLETIIHDFRLCKSDHELALMRHAVNISVNAHKRAMQICKPGLMEYQLAAEIQYEFQKNGCISPAYTTIVGSGKNACVLHYIQNDTELKSSDLVLIDAGAEYKNYAADITRAFPVNGKFSPEQKQIYELVLQAQKAALKVAVPGALWASMQEAIIKTLTEGLVELGILKGNITDLIQEKAYVPFYMHNSGHWLGMDVHDVGTYKLDGQWRMLEPNMVLTIEPGLYISAGTPGVAEKWWNIGVRIEDDVLITKTGNEVLSEALPKEVTDIEALMQT